MLDKFKDMGKLVKQAKEMKDKMKKVQGELKNTRVTGSDRSGKVTVVLSGELECLTVSIDPSFHSSADKVTLEQALREAFNKAANDAKGLATNRLSDISAGLNIPGLT